MRAMNLFAFVVVLGSMSFGCETKNEVIPGTDGGRDSTVADTSVADTSVSDTGLRDSAVSDARTDAAQDAAADAGTVAQRECRFQIARLKGNCDSEASRACFWDTYGRLCENEQSASYLLDALTCFPTTDTICRSFSDPGITETIDCLGPYLSQLNVQRENTTLPQEEQRIVAVVRSLYCGACANDTVNCGNDRRLYNIPVETFSDAQIEQIRVCLEADNRDTCEEAETCFSQPLANSCGVN